MKADPEKAGQQRDINTLNFDCNDRRKKIMPK